MLILIAALACGIALARDPYLRTDRDMIAIVGWAESLKVNQALFYFVLLLVCITPLTFTLPILVFRQHPRSFRRSVFRPGLGGCLAVTFALLLRGFENLPNLLRKLEWQIGPIQPWFFSAERVGYAVIGAWAILAFGGRWRIGPGWSERLGVLVGLLWVIGAMGLVVCRIRWSAMILWYFEH